MVAIDDVEGVQVFGRLLGSAPIFSTLFKASPSNPRLHGVAHGGEQVCPIFACTVPQHESGRHSEAVLMAAAWNPAGTIIAMRSYAPAHSHECGALPMYIVFLNGVVPHFLPFV